MLAASRRPHNPNRTTDDIGWDSGDLSSFLTGVDINGKTLLKNDTKPSNKSIHYYQTAPKRELAAEIIRTFNHNQLNLLNGINHIQTCNDRLLCVTKNRNNTVVQLKQKMKYLEDKMKSLYSLLFRAKLAMPDLITQSNTTKINSSNDYDSNHLMIEENLTINTIQSQTLFANPRLSIITKKVNESINITKNNNNSTAKVIVKPPSADLAASDLNKNNFELSIPNNIPSLNTSQDKQTTHAQSTEPTIKPTKIKKLSLKKQKKFNKNKRRKNKYKINITKNKPKNINIHHKRQQKHPKTVSAPQITEAKSIVGNNECTSMTLPYIPNTNKQQKQNKGINIVRKDIDIKMRYGIYRTSKCLEKQIQDIKPYEEYVKDEQQAYNELNQSINYAVFNR